MNARTAASGGTSAFRDGQRAAILAAAMAPDRLVVRVNDDLVLDAGSCERVQGTRGAELLVRPPVTTLFEQVVAYLGAQPDPPHRRTKRHDEQDGLAAAAVALRWGSYLAVLLDHDKPTWAEVASPRTSRIADAEMARIAIEATAALAAWIDLFRKDAALHERLAARAVHYLPMPRLVAGRSEVLIRIAALADPAVAERMVEATPPARRERARIDAEACPSRVLANAMVNAAWRNGPVEDVHAGAFRGYPLDRRRMTDDEEHEVLGAAVRGLGGGMEACRAFAAERPPRAWHEQVLPFGLAEMLLVTPSGWSLTETSREVRLPG